MISKIPQPKSLDRSKFQFKGFDASKFFKARNIRKSTQVCKFYLKSVCKLGSKCFYLHNIRKASYFSNENLDSTHSKTINKNKQVKNNTIKKKFLKNNANPKIQKNTANLRIPFPTRSENEKKVSSHGSITFKNIRRKNDSSNFQIPKKIPNSQRKKIMSAFSLNTKIQNFKRFKSQDIIKKKISYFKIKIKINPDQKEFLNCSKSLLTSIHDINKLTLENNNNPYSLNSQDSFWESTDSDYENIKNESDSSLDLF